MSLFDIEVYEVMTWKKKLKKRLKNIIDKLIGNGQ